MTIVEKATGRSVGIGAFQNFDGRRRVEAGLVLDGPSRGRGFGKEALRALVDLAFQNDEVDELWLQHAAEHGIAGRVPASLGFLRAEDASDYDAADGNRVWFTSRAVWAGLPYPSLRE